MSERRNFRFCVNWPVVGLVCLLPVVSALASDDVPPPPEPIADSVQIDTLVTDTAVTKVDTLAFVPPANAHLSGEVANPVDLETHLTQNPTVALFKSLFVPGWGQLGNRRYFKAALFAGLETWFVSRAIYYGGKASDAQDYYDAQTDKYARASAYTVLDQKRKSRNKFIWFAGITAFVSMFDAYVDAHLSGSPTDKRNDKFGFEVAPSDDGGVKASVSFAF